MSNNLKLFANIWAILGAIFALGGMFFLLSFTLLGNIGDNLPVQFKQLCLIQIVIGLSGLTGAVLVLLKQNWAKWLLVLTSTALPIHIFAVIFTTIKHISEK